MRALALAFVSCLLLSPLVPAAADARPTAAQVQPVDMGKPFVLWGGTFWTATILRTNKDGSARIHYDGWGDEWDETVDASRLRRAAPAGELFVEWGGQWWKATILRTNNDGSAFIHYDGWGPEWDETVPAARMVRLAR